MTTAQTSLTALELAATQLEKVSDTRLDKDLKAGWLSALRDAIRLTHEFTDREAVDMIADRVLSSVNKFERLQAQRDIAVYDIDFPLDHLAYLAGLQGGYKQAHLIVSAQVMLRNALKITDLGE